MMNNPINLHLKHKKERLKRGLLIKKEFIERTDYHKYTGTGDDLIALFFDWKEQMGYKYCVYARACNATKQELINVLYNIIVGRTEETDYCIQLVVAPIDELRFNVPTSGSGLYTLINSKKLKDYLEQLLIDAKEYNNNLEQFKKQVNKI